MLALAGPWAAAPLWAGAPTISATNPMDNPSNNYGGLIDYFLDPSGGDFGDTNWGGKGYKQDTPPGGGINPPFTLATGSRAATRAGRGRRYVPGREDLVLPAGRGSLFGSARLSGGPVASGLTPPPGVMDFHIQPTPSGSDTAVVRSYNNPVYFYTEPAPPGYYFVYGQYPDQTPLPSPTVVNLGGQNVAELDALASGAGFEDNTANGGGTNLALTLGGAFTASHIVNLFGYPGNSSGLARSSVSVSGSGSLLSSQTMNLAGDVTVTGGSVGTTPSGSIFLTNQITDPQTGAGTFQTATTVTFTGTTAHLRGGTVSIGLGGTDNTTTYPTELILDQGALGDTDNLVVGAGTSSDGRLTLRGGANLSSVGNVYVASAGNSTGTLTISGGAQLSNVDGYLGYGMSAPGTATVDGANSQWNNSGTLTVGYASGGAAQNGTLTISNGGLVSSLKLTAIAGSVDGGGNTVSSGSAYVEIGSGGKLLSGTTLGSGALSAVVGYASDSSGSVFLHGSGSTWEAVQRMEIGHYGTGFVVVADGGTLQVDGDRLTLGSILGSAGLLTFDKGGGANPALVFNNINSQFLIGDQGGGQLFIRGGAQITTGADVILGNGGGSGAAANLAGEGEATVQDADSSWRINGNLTVGLNGTGHLTIQDGTTVTVGGTAVLAQEAGSVGRLTLDGAGSKLTFTNDSNTLEIGRHGNGTLELTGGATVSLPTTRLGTQTDGTGVITVDGAGTKLTVDGLTVGDVSGKQNSGGTTLNNALTISGGGQVMSTGNLYVGGHPNSYGFLQLTGLNSKLTITPDLTQFGDVVVGQSGTGEFEVSNQAIFTASKLDVAEQGGSTGTVNVLGTGGGGTSQTLFTTNGTLTVGAGGTGHFKAGAGAQVVANGDVVLGASSTSQGSTLELSDPMTALSQPGHALTIGEAGSATVTVQNGASYTATGTTVKLGGQDGSSGTLTITGDGAKFDGSPRVTFGGKNGALNVQAGGQATLGSLTLNSFVSNGVTVSGVSSTGTASTLDVQSLNYMSTVGDTTVMVSGGGKFTVGSAAAINVDGYGGSPAQFTVTGSGPNGPSLFSAPNATISFGQTGAATVQVMNGGTLTTSSGTLGNGIGVTSVTVGGGAGNATWNVGSGGSAGNLSVYANGSLKLGDHGTINVTGQFSELGGDGGAVTVNGDGAALNLNGNFDALVEGRFDVMRGSVASNAPLSLDGPTTVAGANSSVMAPMLTLLGSSSLTLSDSATVTVGSRAQIGRTTSLDLTGGGRMNLGSNLGGTAADGQIAIGPGGKLVVNGTVTVRPEPSGVAGVLISPGIFGAGAGVLSGGGTINGRVVNGGKVTPNDPQTLTINGDYVQTGTGLLQIYIAGTDPAQMDHLVVSGQTSLGGGRLELDFIAGFAPHTGDIFNFLSSATLDPNGHGFDEVDITGLAAGFQYNVQTDPDHPANYELVALNDGVSTTVPEPGTWACLGLGAGALLLAARRRSRLDYFK